MAICPLSRYVRAFSPTSRRIHTLIHERYFLVHKTRRSFSSIALDYAREQVNAIVKGDGSAVGLTENPAAVSRCMVAGPEVTRMVEEFESNVTKSDSRNDHGETQGVQSVFANDVLNVISSTEEFGNPFMEQGKELAIQTKGIMSKDVADTVRTVEKLGNEQFQTFMKERFTDRSTPITEPLKGDCALFSSLYSACHSRDGNLQDFFWFENQPWPISLSQVGNLRAGQKADLVKCLHDATTQTVKQPTVDAIILDGAAIVQMLKPRMAHTFEGYFNIVFAPHILRRLDTVNRVDLV